MTFIDLSKNSSDINKKIMDLSWTPCYFHKNIYVFCCKKSIDFNKDSTAFNTESVVVCKNVIDFSKTSIYFNTKPVDLN